MRKAMLVMVLGCCTMCSQGPTEPQPQPQPQPQPPVVVVPAPAPAPTPPEAPPPAPLVPEPPPVVADPPPAPAPPPILPLPAPVVVVAPSDCRVALSNIALMEDGQNAHLTVQLKGGFSQVQISLVTYDKHPTSIFDSRGSYSGVTQVLDAQGEYTLTAKRSPTESWWLDGKCGAFDPKDINSWQNTQSAYHYEVFIYKGPFESGTR